MTTFTVSGAKPGGFVAALFVMFTSTQAEEGQVTARTVEVEDVVCLPATSN